MLDRLRDFTHASTPQPRSLETVAWRYVDARGHFRYRGYRPDFDVEYAILKPIALVSRTDATRLLAESQAHNAKLEAQVERLRVALTDMLSGWKYIRSTHGDLYGVGWDRAQEKAEKALDGNGSPSFEALLQELAQAQERIEFHRAMTSDAQQIAAAAQIEAGDLRHLLESRPAMNAGLAQAYADWTSKVYLAERHRAALKP